MSLVLDIKKRLMDLGENRTSDEVRAELAKYDETVLKEQFRAKINGFVWDKTSDVLGRSKDSLLSNEQVQMCNYPYFIKVNDDNGNESRLYFQYHHHKKSGLIFFNTEDEATTAMNEHIEDILSDMVNNYIVEQVLEALI